LSGRSQFLPVFANGVQVSDEKDIDRIKRLADAAGEAVEALYDLAYKIDNASDSVAAKAWKKVFRHTYFDDVTESKSAGLETKSALGGTVASVASPAIAALGIAEKSRRAEAAVQAIRETGRDTKPWGGSS